MVDVASDKAGAKQLLQKSKSEPVSCALAMAEDGKSPIMLLDKIKGPRPLLQSLQKDYPKTANPRFGTAEVDTDKDPKLVRLKLDKAGGGYARRLLKILKGTGFSKVEIVLEDGSVVDSAGENDETETETPPPPPAPPHHDAAQLMRALRALVERVAAMTDAAQRTPLLKLANEAQNHLKTADLATAELSIVALNKALTATAKTAEPKAPATKLQPLWQQAKESIDPKLEQLARQLRDLDDDDANDVAEFGLFGITGGTETVGLVKALMEYDAAATTAREKAASGLRNAVADYRATLDSSGIVDLLDDNPWGVDITMRATLETALQQIEAAIN